jgi:NADH-quinone oxidoreductase subunit N
MSFATTDLLPILPELVTLTVACTILVVDVYLRDAHKGVNHVLAIIGLIIAIGSVVLVGGGERQVAFDGSFVRDAMSDALKGLTFVVTLLTLAYARPWLRDRGLLAGEFYVLILFAVLGMLIMISANSLLTLYLGLELLALCLYALVAFDRDSKVGAEAAMKYFVLGAIGSGMLLYGASMIYGATGSIELGAIAQSIAGQDMENKVLVFGVVFLVVGIGFKFGAVPFHMWVPDIYQGAPTPVVAFLSSVPKLAAFALAVRLLVEGLGGMQPDWQGMLVILAVLSIGLGNLVAIAQTNIKRMLAYSTISHVGFLFLGLLAGTAQGYASAMFYAMAYAPMAAGAFGILALTSRKGLDVQTLDDLKGLNQRDSWHAAMMALLMFSMAGVPPTVGFMAKLLVLEAVVRVDLLWLALVAVFFSIIGAFYYLRVVKAMYFDAPLTDSSASIGGGARVAMAANGLAILVLGLFPASLIELCQGAFL